MLSSVVASLFDDNLARLLWFVVKLRACYFPAFFIQRKEVFSDIWPFVSWLAKRQSENIFPVGVIFFAEYYWFKAQYLKYLNKSWSYKLFSRLWLLRILLLFVYSTYTAFLEDFQDVTWCFNVLLVTVSGEQLRCLLL